MTTTTDTRTCTACLRLRTVCGHGPDRAELDAETTAMTHAIVDAVRRHTSEIADIPELDTITQLVEWMTISEAARDRAADAVDITAVTTRLRDRFTRITETLRLPNPVAGPCNALIERLNPI